ncbi:MAG: hypothetical protein IT271_04400, partial [Chitinophagales bacterium]|nr:hypothetical protein [Chitinophagales bacterium]
QNVLADTPTQDSFTVYLPADYTIINPSLIEVDIISATDNIPFKGLYSGSALLFKDVDTSASAYKVIHANATIQADGQVNILFGGNAEAKRFSGLVQPNGTVSGDIFNIEGGAISSVKPDLSISFFQNAAPALSGQITLDNPSSVENIRKIKLELNKEF